MDPGRCGIAYQDHTVYALGMVLLAPFKGNRAALCAPVLALGLAALSQSSCTSTAARLKTRFARETGCREEVTFVQQTGSRYRASGCGKTTEYDCATFANTSPEAPCQQVGIQRGASPTGDSPPQVIRPVDQIPPGSTR